MPKKLVQVSGHAGKHNLLYILFAFRQRTHHFLPSYITTAFLQAGEDSPSVPAGPSSSSSHVGQPGPRSVQVAMGRQLTVPQALGEGLACSACRGVVSVFTQKQGGPAERAQGS